MKWKESTKGKHWESGKYSIKHGERYPKNANVSDALKELGPDIFHCYYNGLYIWQETTLDKAKKYADIHYKNSEDKN